MTLSSPPQPTLEFYRRDGCAPCDEARIALQIVLEERVKRGDPIPRVRYRDVELSPELEITFGARIPVIVVGTNELSLTLSERSIARFLDRVLGRAA
jgi:hypothetical protein